MNEENKRDVYSWRGRDVLVVTLGIILIFLVAWGISQWAFTGRDFSNGQLSIWYSIAVGGLEGVALIGGVYLFGLHRLKLSWKEVGLRSTARTWLVLGVLFGLLAIPLAGLIATAVQTLLGKPLTNPQLDFLAPEGFSWTGAVGMFIMGGLVAPLAEEIFFRGVLYSWLQSTLGVRPGIILSGILFGAVHGEISIAVATGVMGIALAWIYERSQSLWPAVIIHSINNGVKIILLYLLLAVDPTLVVPGL